MTRERQDRNNLWNGRVGMGTQITLAVTTGAVCLAVMVLVVVYVYGMPLNLADGMPAIRYQPGVMLLAALGGGTVIIRLLVGRMVKNPLARMSAVSDRMALGDLSGRMSIQTRDEFGTMARSFDAMQAQLSQLIRNVTEGARMVMAGHDRIRGHLLCLRQGFDTTERTAGVLAMEGENQAAELREVLSLGGELQQKTEAAGQRLTELGQDIEILRQEAREAQVDSERLRIKINETADRVCQAAGSLSRWVENGESTKSALEQVMLLAEQVSLLSLSLYAGETGSAATRQPVVTSEWAEEAFRLAERIKSVAAVATVQEEMLMEEGREVVVDGERETTKLARWVEQLTGIQDQWQRMAQVSTDILSSREHIAQELEKHHELTMAVSTRIERGCAAAENWTKTAREMESVLEEEKQTIGEIESNTTKLGRTVVNLDALLRQYKLEETIPGKTPDPFARQALTVRERQALLATAEIRKA